MVSIIAAIDANFAIGREGDQLAYIRDDLKRFKNLTMGKPVVMGRKTFEALPGGALKNRRNIVMSRQYGLTIPGCEVISSPLVAMESCKKGEELFIIGGREIYDLFFSAAERLYLTRIHHSFEGADTWFPRLKMDEWKMIEFEGPFTDDKSGLSFSFEVLERPGECRF